MATVDIDEAHVFPEDTGTDAPTDYTQPASAGHFGGLIRHPLLLDYVAEGLTFQPDYGTTSLDITDGLAYLGVDGPITVEDENEEFADTWRSGMGIPVDVPEVTGISLTSADENHVFLAVDMSVGDGAYYEVNTTDERPVGPYVKIGTVDTETEEHEEFNREPNIATPAYVDSEVSTAQSEVEADLSSHESTTQTHGSNGDIAGMGDITAENADALSTSGGTVTGDVTFATSGSTDAVDISSGRITLDGRVEGDLGHFHPSGDSVNIRLDDGIDGRWNNSDGTLFRIRSDGGIDVPSGRINAPELRGSIVGDMLNRNAGVTNLEGNIWHLEEGEPLPSDAEPGDTIIRYE